jgi:hypothetical protein
MLAATSIRVPSRVSAGSCAVFWLSALVAIQRDQDRRRQVFGHQNRLASKFWELQLDAHKAPEYPQSHVLNIGGSTSKKTALERSNSFFAGAGSRLPGPASAFAKPDPLFCLSDEQWIFQNDSVGKEDFALALASLRAFRLDIASRRGNGLVELLSFHRTVRRILLNLNHRADQFRDLANGQTRRG